MVRARLRQGLVPFALLMVMAHLPIAGAAQFPSIDGYVLNVGGYGEETVMAPGGWFDFQRVRLTTRPGLGPLQFEVAYEHTLDLRSGAGGDLVEGVGGVSTGGDWLDLDGTIRARERLRWRHRADRLNVAATLPGGVRMRAGRQTISWASTLLLTPADPFAPFDPADPFREFRGGVDALRFQYFPGPFTELEVVVRPLDVGDETLLTALGRWKGLVRGWELGIWSGVLHDEFGIGSGTAGSIGSLAVRAEGALRRGDDDWVVRGAMGLDALQIVADRDLYWTAELRYDGFGARDGPGLMDVLLGEPYGRGELQMLGRWAAASSVSLQAHPLLSTELLVLASLSDGSALVGPGVTYSVSDEVSLRLGGFAGWGREARDAPGGGILPGSEFGAAPAVLYAALSAFF